MNRNAYRAARRLIRDNGSFALRWMTDDEALTMATLLRQPCDPLSHASWVLREFGQPGALAELRYRCDVKRQSLTIRATECDVSCHPATNNQ